MCVQDAPAASSSRFAELVGKRELPRATGGDIIARASSNKQNDLRRFSDQLLDNFRGAADKTRNIGANYRKRTTLFCLAMTMSATAVFMPSLAVGQAPCKFTLRTGCLTAGAVCSPVDSGQGEFGRCTTSGPPGQRECNCVGTPETPPPPEPRPWDVMLSNDELDDNGFLRTPVWNWAKQGGPQPLQDACNSCPCGDKAGVWNATPSCTNQSLHENKRSWADPLLRIACNSRGHVNWFPVEYEGTLTWDDHATVFDNDYSWDILSKNNDLALASGSNNNRTAVHLEFDSFETVNDWNGTNTWWDHFHHDQVDQHDKTVVRSWFGSKFAIVIGMLDLDLAESDHHTELHPVYAMFIRLPGEPAGVHWAFFVRNWGNEGYCGPDDVPIPNTQIRVRIPDQTLLAKNVFPYAHGSDQCDLQDPTIQSTTDGALLTFELPPASKKCGFFGDLWMEPCERLALGCSVPVSGGAAGAFEREDEDPVLRAKVARLEPSARRQLDEQLSIVTSEPRGRPIVRQMELIRKPPAHFERPRVAPALPNYGEGLKAVPNPAWHAAQEKRRRFIDSFLKAHGID